jgi:hypothetical protein
MHIRISQCARVTRHPARRRISRKQDITKTRKPETKCRRLPEPQHSLCMRFTVRFVEAWAIADRRRCPAPRPVQRRASPRSPGSFANRASPAHRHLGYPRAWGPRWSGSASRWPNPIAACWSSPATADGVGCARDDRCSTRKISRLQSMLRLTSRRSGCVTRRGPRRPRSSGSVFVDKAMPPEVKKPRAAPGHACYVPEAASSRTT